MGSDVRWRRVTQAPHTFQHKTQLVVDPIRNMCIRKHTCGVSWKLNQSQSNVSGGQWHASALQHPLKLWVLRFAFAPRTTLTAVGGHSQRPRLDLEAPQIAETCVERQRGREKEREREKERKKERNFSCAPWYTLMFYYVTFFLQVWIVRSHEKETGLAKPCVQNQMIKSPYIIYPSICLYLSMCIYIYISVCMYISAAYNYCVFI